MSFQRYSYLSLLSHNMCARIAHPLYCLCLSICSMDLNSNLHTCRANTLLTKSSLPTLSFPLDLKCPTSSRFCLVTTQPVTSSSDDISTLTTFPTSKPKPIIGMIHVHHSPSLLHRIKSLLYTLSFIMLFYYTFKFVHVALCISGWRKPMSVNMHMEVTVHVVTSCTSLYDSLPFCLFDTDSLSDLDLTGWTRLSGWQHPGIYLSLFLQHWGSDT